MESRSYKYFYVQKKRKVYGYIPYAMWSFMRKIGMMRIHAPLPIPKDFWQ